MIECRFFVVLCGIGYVSFGVWGACRALPFLFSV